jgi:SAM-dependent methyltransferase
MDRTRKTAGRSFWLSQGDCFRRFCQRFIAALLAISFRRSGLSACLRALPPRVSLVRASAEEIPFASLVFDSIVMTWTLCSIPNPTSALAEMRRVLKLGGQLLFVEHGLSPERGVARWQHRLTPCWSWISGGCHLDRKTDDLLRAAGFQINALQTGYMKGPKPWTFIYEGAAESDVGRNGNQTLVEGL